MVRAFTESLSPGHQHVNGIVVEVSLRRIFVPLAHVTAVLYPMCCFCVFISLVANPVSTRIATVVFTDDVA